MSTMIIETKVTYKYLMNRTKDNLATWLLSQLDFIEDLERFHPRAMKLMRKKKNFIVIAQDEPYFGDAYRMIRDNEIAVGRWNNDDEDAFNAALHPVKSP